MQITNKPFNIQNTNLMSFDNPSPKRNNILLSNNLSLLPKLPEVSSEKTNLALRAIVFAGKTEQYKKINTFQVPFYKDGHLYELKNGQKIIIIPKPGSTTINTFVNVGSMNETVGIAGISHFIEHILFKGSRNLRPDQFSKDLGRMGVFNNANTGNDYTSYYISTSSKNNETLEKIVKLHAELIQYPTFTPEMVSKEKRTVINEINNYKDNPYDDIQNLSIRNLFNIKTRFKGNPVLGSSTNIRKLTSEKLLEYYNNWYTPENMTTVIVGEIPPSQAIKLAAKYFDKPAKQIDKKDKYCKKLQPIQKTVRKDIINPRLNASHLIILFAGPQRDNVKETIAADALMTFLSGYRGTKLNKALNPLDTEPNVGLQTISPNPFDPQTIHIEADFMPGNEEKGLEVIKQCLQDIIENPPSEKEMGIIKDKLTDELNRISEFSAEISNLVGITCVNHGKLGYYSDHLELINNLTSEDIQNVSKKYLNMDKASIVVARPTEKPNGIGFAGRNRNNSLANITEHHLPNNVCLILNDDPNAIRTSVNISFILDDMPVTEAGVADILQKMLEKGTKKRSENKLNDILDVNCINISPDIGNNLIGIDISCLDKKLPLALEVAKEILLQPSLTNENFKKAKREVKLELKGNIKDAEDRAFETLFSDHPLKNTDRLSLETITQINFEDVKAFYNQIMEKPKVRAVITGNLSKDSGELKEQIINSLGKDIPTVQEYKFVNNEKSAPLDKTKVVLEADDRNQAHIVQISKIKETGHIKDHVSIVLLNMLLGGTENSRLYTELREKQGLAYEVGSEYHTNNKLGHIILNIKTKIKDEDKKRPPAYKNVQKSINGFKKHINSLINNKISLDELNEAKNCLKDAFGTQTETSAQKTDLVSSGFNTKYGASYAKEYLKAIDEVSVEDIQRVAKIHLTQPSVISIMASQDTLDNSRNYLKSFGEIKEF